MNLGKFDERAEEGIFRGYSQNSKTFRVFNNSSRTVEESINVKFIDPSMIDVCDKFAKAKIKNESFNS